MQIEMKDIGSIVPYEKNPRKIGADAIEKVANSIKAFGWQQPIVVDKNGVIIVGHTRLLAARSLELKQVPVLVAKDLTEEQVKAYRLADNKTGEFSEWDEFLLGDELDDLFDMDFDMTDFGFDSSDFTSDDSNGEGGDSSEIIPDPNAEELINETWKQLASEYAEQFDILSKHGFTFSGITRGYAKICFLRAKYYNVSYPRHCSLAFHTQQFTTNGDLYSAYTGLQKVANGEIKPERLRFVSGDNINRITQGSLSFSGSRMPLDFPVDLARSLIAEFARRGRVLDPCHGWGGRLVGALLENVAEYVGVDPSPLQAKGVKQIFEDFSPYSDLKDAKIITSPFEDVELQDEYFDFALTSPPYFDVEHYQGGKQSHSNYDNYEAWRDGFYSQLITKVYRALKHDSYFALQVGSQRYPLSEDGVEIAKNVGFEYIETRPTNMTNDFCQTKKEKGEVVLILYKK